MCWEEQAALHSISTWVLAALIQQPYPAQVLSYPSTGSVRAAHPKGFESVCREELWPLQEHPEIEWFLWIDSDTMIINPTFEMPLRKFKGKDLIIWGNETALLEGDGRNGTALFACLVSSCTVVWSSCLPSWGRPCWCWQGIHEL